MMSGEVCVAELQAPDQHIYAEWLDGLSLLKPNGHIQTQETVRTLLCCLLRARLTRRTGRARADLDGARLHFCCFK